MSEKVQRPDSTPGPSAVPPARTLVGNRVDFSAALQTFQGPLDLLLYLIKENEVEISEIPIAHILQQYLRFIENAESLDLQTAGEFLVMATTLMEIKSRDLLPPSEQPEETDEIIEDPRSELVRQLLQYRRLKDQARTLEQLQERWNACRPRGMFGDVPEPVVEFSEEKELESIKGALVDVDLYALFAAYEKVLKAILAQNPRNIIYDTESLEDKITRIEAALRARPMTRFAELVKDPNSRADIAATFVALLELIRRRAVRIFQSDAYGNIDVKAQDPEEAEAISRAESAEAEAIEQATLRERDEKAAALAAQGGDIPWARKRAPAKPKFEGVLRPEDLEEIDAEETEIGRRIDAILAAADAISERFEQSRDGRIIDEPPADGTLPAEPETPAAEPPPAESAAGEAPVETPPAKRRKKNAPSPDATPQP